MTLKEINLLGFKESKDYIVQIVDLVLLGNHEMDSNGMIWYVTIEDSERIRFYDMAEVQALMNKFEQHIY